MVGRLVEQQEVGAAHQRLREIEPHPPPAGKARDRIGLARVRKPEAGQQRRRARAGRVAPDRFEAVMQLGQRFAALVRVGVMGGFGDGDRLLHVAQFAVAVLHEVDRRQVDRGRFLRDVGDGPGGGQRDVAGVGQELAANQREQARLAAAVRPDETDLVPRMHGERRTVQQPFRAAGEGEVGEAEHGQVRRYGFNSKS